MVKLNRLVILYIVSAIFLNGLWAQQSSFCEIDNLYKTSVIDSPKMDVENVQFFPEGKVLNIRTVIHVLYNTPSANFRDEQILELVDEINAIFQGEVDSTFVNPVHLPLIHDSKIKFCLANIDPDGEPTTGITHKSVNEDRYFPHVIGGEIISPEAVKMDLLQGTSPWDVSRYFNVWIAPMVSEEVALNYGTPFSDYFPLGNYAVAAIPGAVIDTKTITEEDLFNSASSIFAHEYGHAFGLMHTFGPLPEIGINFCDTDDFMEDTPNCRIHTYCLGDELYGLLVNACIDSITGGLPDNASNIMGYACQQMFTPDQTKTMRANLALNKDLVMDESECGEITSINNLDNNQEIEVYPNPSTGNFYINFLNGKSADAKLSLFSMEGKLIESEILSSNTPLPYTWNLQGESTGLYFILIEMNDLVNIKKVVLR